MIIVCSPREKLAILSWKINKLCKQGLLIPVQALRCITFGVHFKRQQNSMLGPEQGLAKNCSTKQVTTLRHCKLDKALREQLLDLRKL